MIMRNKQRDTWLWFAIVPSKFQNCFLAQKGFRQFVNVHRYDRERNGTPRSSFEPGPDQPHAEAPLRKTECPLYLYTICVIDVFSTFINWGIFFMSPHANVFCPAWRPPLYSWYSKYTLRTAWCLLSLLTTWQEMRLKCKILLTVAYKKLLTMWWQNHLTAHILHWPAGQLQHPA